jgi:hypothetical protein
MKITKKILILLLTSLYASNKAAEETSLLGQRNQGYGTLVNQEMKNLLADDLSNVVELLREDLQAREAQVRKKGRFKDLKFKTIDDLTGNIIEHFSAHNLQGLLEKYQQQRTLRELLTQFRQTSDEINENLKATKSFFGSRSAANEQLIENAIRNLSGLHAQINDIARNLYAKEREVERNRLEAKNFIARLNEDSKNGIVTMAEFNGKIPRLINTYLRSDAVEEGDKQILRDFMNYIQANFDYHYDYLSPAGNDTDHQYTRKN